MAKEAMHNDGLSGGPPKYFGFVETPSGVLAVGSCVRGISRSTDGGDTWEPVGDMVHVSVNTFAVDPDGALLAATSGGLARSTDDALTWEMLDNDPQYAVLPSGNDRPEGETVFRLCELADGRVLAGTDGNGVFVREDGEWSQLGLAGMIVYSIAETPDGTILVGTRGDAMQRSSDGGKTWEPSGEGLEDVFVHSILLSNDGLIRCGTGQGISVSSDDGKTWSPDEVADDLYGQRMFSMMDLSDGRTVAGSYAHMWMRDGDRWAPRDPGLTPDESWSVHLNDDDSILAGSKMGVLKSNDDGKTWQKIGVDTVVYNMIEDAEGQLVAAGADGVMAGPDWKPLGDIGQRVWTLLEAAPGKVLGGTLRDGLFSHDASGWQKVPGGPDHWQVYALHRSMNSSRIVLTTGAIIDGEKSGGIFFSDDDGETWTKAYEGRSVYKLAQTSDGTIYAGARRCYILRSKDDGATWEELPLPQEEEAKLYALYADADDRLYVAASGNLLRSSDGGESWTLLEDSDRDGVSVYAMKERPSDNLLIAATSAGMFISETRGESWFQGEIVD